MILFCAQDSSLPLSDSKDFLTLKENDIPPHQEVVSEMILLHFHEWIQSQDPQGGNIVDF